MTVPPSGRPAAGAGSGAGRPPEQVLEPAMPRPAWQAVASLAAIGAVAGAVIGGTASLTAGRIAANEAAALRGSLTEVLPAALYDNAPEKDTVSLPVDGAAAPARPVFRARRGGQATAAVYWSETPDGYAGPIALLVGVTPDGTVLGVRVRQHRETPGIGDFIERRRSPWIDQFAGRSLASPAPDQWQLAGEGGDFDAVAGATVTSRALVGGVRRVLEYHQRHGDAAFAP